MLDQRLMRPRPSAQALAGVQFFVHGSRTVAIDNVALRLALNGGILDFSQFEPDGSDLIVTQANGVTPVPFWIEDFDSVNEVAVIWANLPEVPASREMDAAIGRVMPSDNVASASSFDDTFHKFQVTADCVALFHFDEGSGEESADSGPGEFTAVLVGEPDWDDEATRHNHHATQTFSSGASVVLNGTDQHIEIDGLLDACPPSFTFILNYTVDGTDYSQLLIRSLGFKRWDDSPSAFWRIGIYNNRLIVSDAVGNTVGDSLTWVNGQHYVIAVVRTPTRLVAYRTNPATQALDLVLDSWLYTTAHLPAPQTGTRYNATYPPANPSPFLLGASWDAMDAAELHAGGTYDEFLLEARAMSKDEIESRAVKLTNHIPSCERDYWMRSAGITIAPPEGSWEAGLIGEVSPTGYDVANHRIWAGYTGGAPQRSGIAYSDDYGITWTFPLNHPIVGGGHAGEAGNASHMCFHWKSIAQGGDDYARVFYSQQDENVYLARSVLPFSQYFDDLSEIEFETLGVVFDSSGLTNTPILFNSTVTEGPGGLYFMLVDGGDGGFRHYIATAADIEGPYTELQAGALAGVSTPGAWENGDAGLKYDPDTELLHLWTQVQNVPCEPYHWVSEDGLTWTAPGDDVSSMPAIPLSFGDGTTTSHGSEYADQLGSPDGAMDIVTEARRVVFVISRSLPTSRSSGFVAFIVGSFG